MIDFLKLFCKYVPPYLWRIFLNIILSLISSVFSVFSFAAIVPVLQILFGITNDTLVPVDFGAVDSYATFLEACKSNTLYYLQQQISVKGTAWTLMIISFFIAAMSFIANLASYLATFVRVPVRTGILRDIRNSLYRNITLMPIGYLEKDNRGDVMIRLTNDAEEVDYSLGSLMDIFIKNPTKIIVYLATLFSLSYSLTWFSIVLLLVCIAVLVLVGYVLKKYALIGQIHRGKLLSKFDETMAMLLNIKAYNAEDRMFSTFKDVSNSTRKAFNRTNRHYSLVFPLSDLTVTVVMAVLLFYGGKLILAGESVLGAEEFIYFLMVFSSIIPCVSDIARAGYGIRKAQASVDRINTVLNISEDILETSVADNHKKIFSSHDSEIALGFSKVSFCYAADTANVINDFSLEVEKGRKLAIVGHTGSGKSTLTKLIPRFLELSSGKICVYGQDISKMSLFELREQIAYVGQDSMLFNDTIYNNIVFGNDMANTDDVIRVTKGVGIHEFIMSLPMGYDTIVGDRGTCLSGGQKQCISIARALLKESSILILDEATASLDIESERRIMDYIDSIDGLTQILVTHRLNSIVGCDEVVVLKNGRLVERGNPQDLVASFGYFSNLINV